MLRFDRRVGEELMDVLRPGGLCSGLSALPGRRRDLPLDLQLRAGGSGCYASLYLGLTDILKVAEHKGRFALRVHPTHAAAGGFDLAWSQPITMVDTDLPVEVRAIDDVLVEARIELSDDVDDLNGDCLDGPVLAVTGDGVLAVDPFAERSARDVHVPLPSGRWQAQILSGSEPLAIRLVPATPGRRPVKHLVDPRSGRNGAL